MIFMQFPSVAETQVQTTCDPDMEKRIRARQRMLFDQLQSRCYRTKLPCICPKDDSYHENEAEMTIFLRKVIGAVSFGNPKNKATDENHFTGFDVEQLKSIDKVFECLKSIKDSGGNGVEIAVIVIILIEEDKVTEVPIFRVKVSSEQDTPNHFVDVSARCYKSFEELLLKNDFPSAQFCYPQDGIYSLDGDEVKVFIDDNPAAKERGAVARLSEYAKPIVYASAAALNTLTGYWNKEVAVRLPRSSGLREGFPFLMTPGTLPSAVPIVTNPLETIRKMTQLMVLSLANEVGLSVEMLEALALVWKPYVLSKIKSLLLLQAFSSVEEMLTNLKTLLEGSLKYGP
ncbi:uncharacterized protein LOC117639369, partial [Thrips palmi]|uniref:Uncharacterized protein LOC117639369 n=1 Tax=Thrips palmi TaxID=161013 RepID=A0A6P8XV62_THRPL